MTKNTENQEQQQKNKYKTQQRCPKNSLAEKYWFQKKCVLVWGGFQLMQ